MAFGADDILPALTWVVVQVHTYIPLRSQSTGINKLLDPFEGGVVFGHGGSFRLPWRFCRGGTE